MMTPYMRSDDFNNIANFAKSALNDETTILLTEYQNIIYNLSCLMNHQNFYENMVNMGKIDILYSSMDIIIERLKKSSLDSDLLGEIETFQKNNIYTLKNIKDFNDLSKNRDVINNEYPKIKDSINRYLFKKYSKQSDFNINNLINCEKSVGIKRITIYYLENGIIGINKDSNTIKIKNLDEFAKKNGLPNVKYKLVNKSEIKEDTPYLVIFARVITNKAEHENFRKFQSLFIKDKKSYNLKFRILF